MTSRNRSSSASSTSVYTISIVTSNAMTLMKLYSLNSSKWRIRHSSLLLGTVYYHKVLACNAKKYYKLELFRDLLYEFVL